jgi:hypothetical protein
MSRKRNRDSRVSSPEEAVQHPHKAEHPSYRGVSPKTVPAEDEVERKDGAGYKGREEDESGGADIVEDLQKDNLPDDLQRRELRQGPGARRPSPRGHEPNEKRKWIQI